MAHPMGTTTLDPTAPPLPALPPPPPGPWAAFFASIADPCVCPASGGGGTFKLPWLPLLGMARSSRGSPPGPNGTFATIGCSCPPSARRTLFPATAGGTTSWISPPCEPRCRKLRSNPGAPVSLVCAIIAGDVVMSGVSVYSSSLDDLAPNSSSVQLS